MRILLYIFCLGISGFAISAHASYTVMDDDAGFAGNDSRVAANEYQQYSFQILFLKHRSLLTSEGRMALDNALPYLRGKLIKIVAKSDATIYTGGKLASLVSNRAYRMRDYLIAHAIPAVNISIELDNSPNPQPNGSKYPSYVNVVQKTSGNYSTSYSTPSPVAKLNTSNKSQLQADDLRARDMVISFVLSSAKNDLMAAPSALRLITILSDALPSSSVYAQTDSLSGVGFGSARDIQPYPMDIRATGQTNTGRSMQWMLTPDKTLKENLETWASLANFSLVWNAANPYKVGKVSVINGEVLDAIDRVIAAAGLSMSVSPKTSTIFINDHK